MSAEPTTTITPALVGVTIPLAQIALSKTNPRKNFDKAKLEELAQSIREKGVLQPILVRPMGKSATTPYELVAGERRVRAAKDVGLAEIPAVVRELSDTDVLEIQIIENLHRTDLHPLEEAEGYRHLMAKKYDVAKIAERTGRSIKYVYDRVKLLDLSKALQQEFLDDRITAGHAILLARLSPKEQERAADVDEGGLWTNQHVLFKEGDKENDEDYYKPVSVRELQAWIDEHVKLDAAEADPMIFPDLVQTVATAQEQAEKVVRITYEEITPDEIREAGEKIVLGRSWKRADGKHGSKPCPRSVTGVVAIGAGRGEAFKVCTNKEHCDVHWAKEKRERAKRAKSVAGGKASSDADRWKREEERRQAERAREDALRERWKKAAPAILKAVAERVKKVPAGTAGLLGQLLLAEVTPYGGAGHAPDYVPRGTSAEDLVRHAAFILLMAKALEYRAPWEFPKRAKAFGVDVQKILDEIAPPPAPAKAAAAPPKTPVKKAPKAKKARKK